MEEYKIEVWYRFIIADESEKDFEIHVIKAETEDEAKQKALMIYSGTGKIPFKVQII